MERGERRPVWRQRDFALLWTGQSVSEVGSQVTVLALPTLAIFAFHAGAATVGLLVACNRLPFPILSLLAGGIVDRMARRPLMVVCNLGRLAVLVTIPALAAAGALEIWHLFVAALAMGCFTVFYDIAYLALVPSIVADDQLVEANSRLEVSFSGASLLGPGLGGVLIQAVGAARAVLADAFSFAVSALTVFLMRDTPEAAPRESRQRLTREIADGLRHVFGNPVLRAQVLGMSAAGIFVHACEAPLYVFAYGDLHLSPAFVGLLLAFQGVGAIAATTVTQRVIAAVGVGRSVAVGEALAGGLYGVIPLAVLFPSPAFLFPVFLLAGALSTVSNIAQVTLRQSLSPAALQGRMTSIFRTFFWGVWPLGNLIGGLVAAAVGAGTLLWTASLLGFVASMLLLLTPLGKVKVFGPPVAGIPDGGRGY